MGLAVHEGAGLQRDERLDAVRLHAEPLQSPLPRGGAGDAAALPVRRDRRHPLVAARPRPAGTALGKTATDRAATDEFGRTLYARTEEGDRGVVDRVGAVAETRGLPRAQVALAWMLSRSGVTAPIVGATKPEHLKDAVAAVNVKLSAEEIAQLEESYQPHPVAGFS